MSEGGFERMSQAEVDSLYGYAEALQRGYVEPPEEIEVTDELQKVVDQMLLFKITLGTTDYGHADSFRRKLAVVHPMFLKAAFDYLPPDRKVH